MITVTLLVWSHTIGQEDYCDLYYYIDFGKIGQKMVMTIGHVGDVCDEN